MNWDDTAIACLRRLWANQALSASQIGLRLGATKNAVVGKAHRLGLPSRPSPIAQNYSARPKPMRKPKVTLPPLAVEAAPAVIPAAPDLVAAAVPVEVPPAVAAAGGGADEPAPRPRPVLVRSCCWPMWPNDARPTQEFCGAPSRIKADGVACSYCEDHARRAFTRVFVGAPVRPQMGGRLTGFRFNGVGRA